MPICADFSTTTSGNKKLKKSSHQTESIVGRGILLISARNTWIKVAAIFYCGLRSTSENFRTFRTDKMPTKKRQDERKNSVHLSCPRINFHGGQSLSTYLYIKFYHGIVEHTTLTVTFRRLKTARVTEVSCSPM